MGTRLDTRVHLVAELEKLETKTPLIFQIIEEAKAGEFHDYKNEKYSCGKVAANDLLQRAARASSDFLAKEKLFELASAIRNGDYDEEADESDKEEMRKYAPKALHGVLGL